MKIGYSVNDKRILEIKLCGVVKVKLKCIRMYILDDLRVFGVMFYLFYIYFIYVCMEF